MMNEIKQALEKATPGPWEYQKGGYARKSIIFEADGNNIVCSIAEFSKADGHLIANAPEWLQWSVSEIERLRKEIIDQRNLFLEKAYKLAKISEDAYIRELQDENERLRKALEVSRLDLESIELLLVEDHLENWDEALGIARKQRKALERLKEGKHE